MQGKELGEDEATGEGAEPGMTIEVESSGTFRRAGSRGKHLPWFLALKAALRFTKHLHSP